MSYDDGWAALHLEKPPRVPRTEYSAHTHWELMSSVTGLPVEADSPEELKDQARRAFIGPDGWNYDFMWATGIGRNELPEQYRTSMGHAVYAAGGTDWNTDIHEAFTGPEQVLDFDPATVLGLRDHGELVARFESMYRANREANPDAVNMTGVYITCISGLIELYGWEMLLTAAGLDAERFGEMTERYARWIQQYFDALADADVPVVMIHDDIVWTSGPFIHPDWYRRYVFPSFRRYVAPLLDSGKRVLFTSDGTYTAFIDDIAACGVHGFVIEPTVDMKYIAEKYGRTHVFVGNADTRVLLSGSREAIRAEVERCMAIGKDCPGYFLAVGNHIPPNTPVDAAVYYNEVYEELSRR